MSSRRRRLLTGTVHHRVRVHEKEPILLTALARRVEVVPDWVCEVLSPSTRRHDLDVKAQAYARIGVRHGWYVDPSWRELTVYELREGEWRVVHVHGEGDRANAKPFDSVSIDMASLWLDEPGA